MAGPNLTIHQPILQVQEKAGTTPWTEALPEAAGQNFMWGTPVMLNVQKFVTAWDGSNVGPAPGGILGISESPGWNLPTAGAGAPVPPFGQITGSMSIQTFGIVPNQPGGVNIAIGAPAQDGRTLFMPAREATVFEAMFDSSNTGATTPADFTPVQSDIGVAYGLTKDSAGPFWYVDKFKTGAAAAIQVVAIGRNGSVLNGLVKFVFLSTAIQKF